MSCDYSSSLCLQVPISVADIVDETHPVVAGLSGGYRYTRPEADGEYKLHPGDYLFLIYYERNEPEQESGQSWELRNILSCIYSTTSPACGHSPI